MYTWMYAQAQQWALTESISAARLRVLQNLANYESRKDYPYDAVFLHGAVSERGHVLGRWRRLVGPGDGPEPQRP
jgi:hypothetical protein